MLSLLHVRALLQMSQPMGVWSRTQALAGRSDKENQAASGGALSRSLSSADIKSWQPPPEAAYQTQRRQRRQKRSNNRGDVVGNGRERPSSSPTTKAPGRQRLTPLSQPPVPMLRVPPSAGSHRGTGLRPSERSRLASNRSSLRASQSMDSLGKDSLTNSLIQREAAAMAGTKGGDSVLNFSVRTGGFR